MTQQERWAALSLRERAVRMLPFLLTFGVAILLAFVTRSGLEHPELMALAGILVLGTGAAILNSIWSRHSELLTIIPVLVLCAAIFLMCAASGGGSTSGYGPLLFIPVVWQAMRRHRRELLLTILAVTVTNVGSVFWLSSPASTAAQWRSVVLFTVVAATIGQTIHLLVRERSNLVLQLGGQAHSDPLTGLANRRTWDERLPEAAAAAARSGEPITVAILDLDLFKAYNDAHGHEGGDELLVEVARAWTGVLRSSDLLVRWGGEEFALMLPETDQYEAQLILERLQSLVPSGQTFSAGYTVARFHPAIEADLRRIVRAADAAMYEAKAAGRARVIGAPLIVERAPTGSGSATEER